MDGDEAIDGSELRRRFAGAATLSAEGGMTPTTGAFSDYQSSPTTVRLFDPNRFLAVIAVLFWPLRFLPIVLIPAVFLAGLTMFKHWNGIMADLHRLLGEFSFFVHLLLSLLVINLGVRLAMGVVVRASGGAVHNFGFIFFLGIVPRFYVDRSAIPQLDRNGQLWAYGAPLLVRLGFFAFGMLAWATYRSNGTWAANLALLISQAGLWSFLFAAMPFMLGDGYSWLAIYFRQPALRQKALIALNAKLQGKKLPPGFRRSELPLLIFFAVGVILTLAALALGILIVAALLLTRNLQGVGFVVFLGLMAGFVTWLISFRAMRPQRKQQQLQLYRTLMADQANSGEPEAAPPPSRWTRRSMIWAGGAAVALALAALLPYSYDPAGPFEILPTQGSAVIARTGGEIVDVTVHEGERVRAGQVLAHLSSWDQQRETAITREEWDGAEARLTQLRGTALSSDQDALELAQNEVKRLRQQLETDQAEWEHTTIRAPVAGVVTTPNPQFLAGVWVNAGEKLLQIDDSDAAEAEIEIPQGDMALVKPGATVRLRPWSQRNGEIVGRVTAVESSTAMSGTVPSSTMSGPAAASIASGDDSDAVRTDGLAPNVGKLPQRARTKRELGKAAAAKTDVTGVIRVKALVPAAGTLLRPAMTGYARISGPEMSLGQAYLRLGIRFFTVELWSWVP